MGRQTVALRGRHEEQGGLPHLRPNNRATVL